MLRAMDDPLDRWNRRFSGKDYVFGTEPAEFLTRHAHYLAPGSTVLAVADGEGRNSVWLAGQGMRVTAMDGSSVALDKARALARQKGVSVDYRLGDITKWDWAGAQYDAVVGIFFQFVGPALRAQIFAGFDTALTPGGLLLIHGYAPRQVGYATGGPKAPENMYDLPLLNAAFPGYDVLHQADYDADIDEGEGHKGRSGLIDFVARKPARNPKGI